ncbi:hypothetical protein F5141DRAFT_1079858 [Pisolithus sp. B1]|nr:hypothetical protein F5141DRAFT_1079858 [Pisolithus sp. B1]
MKETGFYVTGVGCADRYVEFKDYVPEYLRGATQLALKEEMARALSESDGPGYIYVVEIRDPSNTRLIQLKRRLDQWDKQCGSKEQRLVHIELADLSLYAPYLEPGWPKTNNSEQSVFSGKAPSLAYLWLCKKLAACTDCGTVHQEIFSFRRSNGGKYKGREWDGIVKPVIEKWGRFIKEYYS